MQGPDHQIMSWIDDHRISWLTSFTTWLMDFGTNPVVVLAAGLVVTAVVIWKRAWRIGIATSIAFWGGGWISGNLKEYFERPRPKFPDALVEVQGFAMPSNHSTVLAAMSVTLLFVVSWSSRKAMVRVGVGLGVWALTIGLAMIYLGAHWPTDVLVGWALGGAIGTGLGLAFRPRVQSA